MNAKSYGEPATAFGGVPLVKTGASFTVRVTASVVDPPTLVAATVNECSPPVVAAGVPVNIPDELRVSPDGKVPELTANVGAGVPVAVKREAVRHADRGRGWRRVGEGRRHHDLEAGGHDVARLSWLRPRVHCGAGRDRHHDGAGTRQRTDQDVIARPRSGDRNVADSGRGSADVDVGRRQVAVGAHAEHGRGAPFEVKCTGKSSTLPLLSNTGSVTCGVIVGVAGGGTAPPVGVVLMESSTAVVTPFVESWLVG